MNTNYVWIPFYEAAVLETDPQILPSRIETPKTPLASASSKSP